MHTFLRGNPADTFLSFTAICKYCLACMSLTSFHLPSPQQIAPAVPSLDPYIPFKFPPFAAAWHKTSAIFRTGNLIYRTGPKVSLVREGGYDVEQPRA